MALPSRLSLLTSILVSTSAANSHGMITHITTKKASQTLYFVIRNFSSCPTHIREQCYKTLLTDVITDGYPVWQPCCRSCIKIHSNNDELAAWSWCCTESGTTTTTTTTEFKMVLSSYPLQVTLNQFPFAYSQTFFPSAIRLRNTLPVDSFKTHLNSFRFIWAPD